MRAAIATDPPLQQQCPGLIQVAAQRLLPGGVVVVRIGQGAVGVVQLTQAQRGFDRTSTVAPQTCVLLEVVVLDEPVPVVGDQFDRLHDVGENRFGDEVVEVDPHPPGFDAFASPGDLGLELVGEFHVDAQ